MKPIRLLLALVIYFFPLFLTAQVNISGSLHSNFYALEEPLNTQRLDYYQGLRLTVTPEKYDDLYLSTYFRYAKRGDDDWEDRFYNLYLNWKTAEDRLQFRLGRQFTYLGVINGTLDGLLVSGKPVENLNVKLFGGLDAPLARDLELREWDEGNVLGAYADYRLPYSIKLDLSYFQKERQDETVWQLVGAGLSGKAYSGLYYQMQIDHNLQTEKLQGMRYRLNYYWQKWSFSGEYNSQRPRIEEDSYFRIFRLRDYDQFRFGTTYQLLEDYQVGLQYIYTDFIGDENNQAILTIGNPWGILGFVYQDGFGGENVGLYGDIRYDLFPQLTFTLNSSYYNFERRAVQISEDATSFSGGFIYRPLNDLSVQIELQESINSFYDNDFRGLFRLNYFFRNKL